MHGALMHEYSTDLPISVIEEPVHWHALFVASGSEPKAVWWLRRRQFKPYWARYRGEPNRIQARRTIRWKSVIPGYLFLPIPMDRHIDSDFFEFAPGIHDFMRTSSGNVVLLSEMEIDQIRSIEDALQASIIAAGQNIPFKVGQKVRIVKPGIDAKIVGITSKWKIIVEAQFLGAPRQWTLAGSEIEAI